MLFLFPPKQKMTQTKNKTKQPRTDKRKNIGKVAEVLANNPQATIREIAQETNLSIGAVHSSKVEVEKSGLLEKILKEHEDRQKIISDDIKDSIDVDLLADFVVLCGSKVLATQKIEEFLRASLGQNKRRRQNVGDNTRYGILHKFGFKCCACGAKPSTDNTVVLHIDHIVPYSMGGLDVENNYQVLCDSCNYSKGDRFIFDHD